MNIHPVAALFPMIEGEAFEQLVEDIREHGLREPIKTWNDVLIDGRNRMRACEAASITPRFEALTFADDGEVIDYIVSTNIHRRHLGVGQRAMLAEEVRPHLADAAKQRLSEAGKAGGRGNKKGLVEKDLPFSSPGNTNVQLGKMFNVGRTQAMAAHKIASDAPELAAKVRAGEMSLNAAYKQVKPGFTKNRKRKLEPEPPPVDVKTLSGSAQEKLAAAIKQEKRKLQGEFEKTVQAEIERLINEMVLPAYQKEMAEFRQIIESRKGVMKRETFRLIRGCLHPDRAPDELKERYTKAFHAFGDLELLLCDEREMPTSTIGIPRDYAEMMQRRAQTKARRRNQSNGLQRRAV